MKCLFHFRASADIKAVNTALFGCLLIGCAGGLLYTYQEYKFMIEVITIILSIATSILGIIQFLKDKK